MLDSSLQEHILNLVEQQESEFAKGLGNGIGQSFRYLDTILQHELLVWVSDRDSQFARNLGRGIGGSFASMSPQIQQQILSECSSADSEFTKGLSEGLGYSFRYLEKEVQDHILKTLTGEHSSLLQQRVSIDSLAGTRKNSLLDHSISENDDFPFPSFITSKSEDILQHSWAASEEEEVSFSGLRQNYCVCFIDMMNSTKIASNLGGIELDKYYSIFLNAMAIIVRNFGGKIIKNAGDALIYYFPDTADSSNISAAFKDVLECGITMMAAHGAINSRMRSERLPQLNYRISADYGMVAVAKSKSSQTDDLFGSAMNFCAKINSKAPANGMVIGEDLYQLVKSLEDFRFERVKEQSDTKYSQYPAYIVQTKEKRNILNPFKRVPESKKEE
jgi:class 3 adenylate cyclase